MVLAMSCKIRNTLLTLIIAYVERWNLSDDFKEIALSDDSSIFYDITYNENIIAIMDGINDLIDRHDTILVYKLFYKTLCSGKFDNQLQFIEKYRDNYSRHILFDSLKKECVYKYLKDMLSLHYDIEYTEASMEEIYYIGDDTIARMNKIVKTSSNFDNEMGDVIIRLRNAIDRYKKYSNINWWLRLWYSELEIRAKVSISMIEFDSLLKKGKLIQTNLLKQYQVFEDSRNQLISLNEMFNDDIALIQDYVKDRTVTEAEYERLNRRINDLIAAQTLCHTTSLQYDLAKNNIGMLVDKFNSIYNVLAPAMQMNTQLNVNTLKF